MSSRSAHSRPLRTLAIVLAAMVATAGVALTGSALARGEHHPRPHAVPAPPEHPTSDRQIQNIGQVSAAIKAYYGDTPTDRVDPVTTDGEDVVLHTFDRHGAYAKQVRRIAHRARGYLRAQQHRRQHAGQHAGQQGDHDGDRGRQRRQPAIVLDVDDTSLNTYNYEIYANFGYDPAENGAFVDAQAFPAVPGMVRLTRAAKRQGYAVFFLTGRPVSQLDGTVGNLARVGFPEVPADHYYLKDLNRPWLKSCAPECSTVEYKSLTRRHIQRQGYRIVANFGDQFSDLEGGHARRTFKLPNPMYYLP